MGPSHRAAAAPLGIGLAFWAPWGALGADSLATLLDAVAHLGLGIAVVGCSKWNDLDHPRFHGRIHVGAWLVRVSARAGYRIRTAKDRRRTDLHRGPSHCLEWCVLFGLVVGLLATRVPPLAPWALWWGVAIFLGTGSHVLLDAMTPSGVPLSALWNLVRHGEVWRRHAFCWRWRAIPTGRFRLSVPRIGVMPVDESAPGCRPGLVTTDSGAEHMIVLPMLWGASATAILAGVGLLVPLLDAMTRGWA